MADGDVLLLNCVSNKDKTCALTTIRYTDNNIVKYQFTMPMYDRVILDAASVQKLVHFLTGQVVEESLPLEEKTEHKKGEQINLF